jgi:two-component system nitrate/nitrite response regulator NarL
VKPKRISAGIRNGSAGKFRALAITGGGSPPALRDAGTTGDDVAQQEGRPRQATIVVASARGETRRRWIRRLRQKLAICGVIERRTLAWAAAKLKPEVLVVDLALPGLRGASDLADIQRASLSARILALTDTVTESEGMAVLKAVAKGYCARTIDEEHLERAVAAVRRGEIWAPRTVVPGLIAELRSLIQGHRTDEVQSDRRLDRLTGRQRAIADLIGTGASNKEIANRLNITERTVKAHLTGAFRNVGVADRLQLALLLRDVRAARASA